MSTLHEEELKAEYYEKFKGWILQDDQEMYRSMEVIVNHWIARIDKAVQAERIVTLEEAETEIDLLQEVGTYADTIYLKKSEVLAVLNKLKNK